jgi:hypothetical protein
MFYQMIVQLEVLHKNHNFATHIPNLFFKTIKVLIHSIIHHLGCACVREIPWTSTSST